MANQMLTEQLITQFEEQTAADPRVRTSRNAVSKVGLDEIAVDPDRTRLADLEMSTKLDDWQVTNQKKSGRCWLFAALNLMRVGTMEKLGLKDFEFSQNYALFWEKLERSNYFLQTMIDLADEPLDSRTIQFLLADVLNDGGQWDMLAALFSKHGVVPKSAMPETHASSNTARMNSQLKLLLRRSALELREITETEGVEAATAKKEQILQQVYRILVVNLGTPPSQFAWQWRDKDGQFHNDGQLSPTEFFEKYVTINLDDYVCLVDDPRSAHPKNAPLTVEHLGNVVGGQEIRYLNVDIALMKQLAADTIRSGEPVWFGCDVGKQSDRKSGLMVDALYDYSDVLGVDLSTTKEQRVLSGESLMTHAMLLVGVDELDGQTKRWRVENSWGAEVGDKGFFTMDDAWFTEYVFEVVVKKSLLPEELQDALTAAPLALAPWDPMGALA